MHTSWRHLAQELQMPPKLFESNLLYLERSKSAPLVRLVDKNDKIVLRHNFGRMRDMIVHHQIKIALSQGTLLVTWQMFEFSIRTMAEELKVSVQQKKGERLALPDRFLRSVEEKFSLRIFYDYFGKQLWNEVTRIRHIRNDVAHEGGIFSNKSKNLNEAEIKFIEPMTDEQLESGEIWGPVNFPADALMGYAQTLSESIQLIGKQLEAQTC